MKNLTVIFTSKWQKAYDLKGMTIYVKTSIAIDKNGKKYSSRQAVRKIRGN